MIIGIVMAAIALPVFNMLSITVSVTYFVDFSLKKLCAKIIVTVDLKYGNAFGVLFYEI